MSPDAGINLWIVTLDNATSYDRRHGYSSSDVEHRGASVVGMDHVGSNYDVPSSLEGSTSGSEPAVEAFLPSVGKVALGLLLSSFVVMAVAGNLLVIVAVLTDRGLRQTGNYFIVSLALADMLVAVAVMTFAVANDVMGRWVFGAHICRLWMSADVMCSTASILNLCAISADRYLHIRSPLHYDRLVTHKRCLGAIGLVWIMSALISFLPIHLGWHRVAPSDSGIVYDFVDPDAISSTSDDEYGSSEQSNLSSAQRRVL
jgi:7 transmembrane receptor (rhodopsin family)